MKQRRNRQPKPAWSFSGLDAGQWRADSKRVEWAQRSPEFRDIMTVLTNELLDMLASPVPDMSENVNFGRGLGAQELLGKLRSLAQGLPAPAPALPMTYEAPQDL